MAKAIAQPAGPAAPFSPFLTLLEQLGEGSFGKVFKALHHASNRILAVKIVPLEEDTGEVAREIEHLKECECPNIVQYHGSFLHEERLWILMEFCEGSSLLDIMAATGQCLTQHQVAGAL